jgi:hypothetical protein
MRACMRWRRACGSSPPLSALTGCTAEARSAGAKPKSSMTPTVSAKPNPTTRQSAGRNRRAGWSGGLIMLTTSGADHQANSPPMAAARKASQALCTRTSCTRLRRPAPMETRNAISRARAAACAAIRLATFAHAISSTRATSTPRAASEVR